MSKTYHLSPVNYILYVMATSFILIGAIVLIASPLADINDFLYGVIVFGVLLISSVYYFNYTLIISDEEIRIKQLFGIATFTIHPSAITDILFKYYYPSKKHTNYGRRGYKFTIENNPQHYIKIYQKQFSKKAIIHLCEVIQNNNKDVHINDLMKKHLEQIRR